MAPVGELPDPELGVAEVLVGLAGVSLFRKNSVSFPSTRAVKTRNDFLSGPTATSTGMPFTRSMIGDCFSIASHGYARPGPLISSPTTTSRDLSSVLGKLMTTGSLAISGSQLLSYSFTYLGTSARTLPPDTSDFHWPKVSSSHGTRSSAAPLRGP